MPTSYYIIRVTVVRFKWIVPVRRRTRVDGVPSIVKYSVEEKFYKPIVPKEKHNNYVDNLFQEESLRALPPSTTWPLL